MAIGQTRNGRYAGSICVDIPAEIESSNDGDGLIWAVTKQ
jgi:hypothetical protein